MARDGIRTADANFFQAAINEESRSTLSQIVVQSILDQTGLTGKYDFELRWTPDQSSPNNALGETLTQQAPVDRDQPNIFTALQEQIGLKLESGKGPVAVIVVDHIETASISTPLPARTPQAMRGRP